MLQCVIREKIFIGSSSESLPYAEAVKNCLQDEYDCVIWNKDFFELNKSTYENLYQKAYGFDYAIFIGGQDSKVFERGHENQKARDNVVFELGLYAGIVSPDRTFFLLHDQCKILSDLEGITIGYFTKKTDIAKRCDDIRAHLKAENKISRVSVMPATTSAISYYNNFISNIYTWYLSDAEFEVNGIPFQLRDMDVEIHVCLPRNPIHRMNSVDADFYRSKNLDEVRVAFAKDRRSLCLRVKESDLKQKKMVIYDVPTILDTSFDVVRMLNDKNCLGDTDWSISLKQKEVRNFMKALKKAANENKWISERLKFDEI